MMATKSNDKVFIQDGEEVIELTGKDKEAFIADRAQIEAQAELFRNEIQAQKEVKKSAYTKLGLTEEEINAIL
jgi:hypothetical protein